MIGAMRLMLASLGLGAVVAAGCGGAGFPDVVDARELSRSFGGPKISRIRDVGAGRIPVAGAWKGESDGVAVPGELLLIEGDNFGRQPTVSIGGRATAIVARTDGGGILARVPTGVPIGEVDVSVAQPKGRAVLPFKVKRFAIVVHDGKAFVLELTKDGAQPAGQPLAIPGARALRMSADGGAAYVLASRPDHDRLVVIDLAAAGGPKLAGERLLSHRATHLATASDAPIAVAVGEGKVTLFNLPRSNAPASYDATLLPKELRAPLAVELSPDGKVLALLLAEGNRLAILDLDKPPAVKPITTVDLLPDQRLSLVRDLAFSSDGETLWVVSGDNAQTLPAIQPTRLTALRLMVEAPPEAANANPSGAPTPPGTHLPSGARLLSVWRTQTVPGAAAPLRLAIARGQPLASGTTIRMPPEKAAVFVTSLNDALFKLGELAVGTAAGAKAALKLWHPPQPGILVRADINGGGGPLFATPQIMSAVDLTPDAQLLLATAARVSPVPATDGVVLDFGVTVSPIWGAPTPLFLPLGPLTAAELKPPFHLGDVRIQP